MKIKLKDKGITLIALVVTIIILLILAGITIAVLTGDNGLISKSNEAKNATDEAAIKENLEVNVLASFKKTKINYDLLNNNLLNINELKYKENPLSDINKIEKLPASVDVKGYKFDILEDGSVEKRPDYETLKSMYGTVVSGYTGYKATDVSEWKLLYVDEENRDAIIIASESAKHGNVPIKNSNNEIYSGYQDVASYEYGKNYNGLWLEKCEEPSNGYNEKTTAYLCDPNNWKTYVTGKAKYAAGGPTIELLYASRYDKQVKDFKDELYTGNGSNIRNVNREGYPSKQGGFTTSLRNQLYNNGNYYFIASPNSGNYGLYLKTDGGSANSIQGTAQYADWLDYYFRPIVCFPASAIKINGENLSV